MYSSTRPNQRAPARVHRRRNRSERRAAGPSLLPEMNAISIVVPDSLDAESCHYFLIRNPHSILCVVVPTHPPPKTSGPITRAPPHPTSPNLPGAAVSTIGKLVSSPGASGGLPALLATTAKYFRIV
jgi:hypothetical protein